MAGTPKDVAKYARMEYGTKLLQIIQTRISGTRTDTESNLDKLREPNRGIPSATLCSSYFWGLSKCIFEAATRCTPQN